MGSQDGFTAHRRAHGKDYHGTVIEFGEMVLATPHAAMLYAGGQPAALEPRCVEAAWVGVHGETGENGVVSCTAGSPAFRVRTVLRRPLGERWCKEAILGITATTRIPDPGTPGRLEIPTPKQAKILAPDRTGGPATDESATDEEEEEPTRDSPEGVRERRAGDVGGPIFECGRT